MAAGYFSTEQVTILQAVRDGHGPMMLSSVEQMLAALNKGFDPPFFKTRISWGDGFSAGVEHDMSHLLIPGNIHKWVAKQGGVDVVAPRLFQSIIDIYKSPKDPTGLVGAGEMLDVLDGKKKPHNDLQYKFVAMFNDLRESDTKLGTNMATELLNLAHKDPRLPAQSTKLSHTEYHPGDAPINIAPALVMASARYVSLGANSRVL